MAFKLVVLMSVLAAANAGLLGNYAHSYASPLAYSAGHYADGHYADGHYGHLSAYSSPIIAKTIAAAPLAYSAPLDHHNHYSVPLSYHAHAPSLAYSSHHHLSAAPIVAKSYAAPLAYSAHHHHHLESPLITKAIATPLIAKTIAAPALAYSAHSDHHLFGAHHYPSHGYAANYGW